MWTMFSEQSDRIQWWLYLVLSAHLNRTVGGTGRARVGRGGAPAPWLLLEFFRNSRLDFKVVTMTWRKKKMEKKKTSTWLKVTKPLLLSCPTATCTYFTIFYFLFYIIIYTIFTIYDTFTVFYSWMMLEILQILLLMSYKFACHQSQKIISNLFIIFFK